MNATHRPSILTLVSHYLPGFKAGGPIRSVANLVAALGNEFDFRIVTRDRDVGDTAVYSNIQVGKWLPAGSAAVCYARPAKMSLLIAREIDRVRPAAIYINSFFDAIECLPPLLTVRPGSRGRVPIIIAPRGQFAAGSLQFQRNRKQLYLNVLRSLGLTRHVIWHATSQGECEDIDRAIGRAARTVLAPNLSGMPANPVRQVPKERGRLRLAFLSRVSPKKNLLGAIEIIASLAGDITLDIWGPVEDRAYEQNCRKQIAALPANVAVRWCGPVEPVRVSETLSQYDALLLPTFGENFGHAIIESLGAGCPVVISDRTPWRNLDSHEAGWDLPLEGTDAFRHALTQLCAMGETEHARMRARSVAYARTSVQAAEHVAAHRQLFAQALAMGMSPALSTSKQSTKHAA